MEENKEDGVVIAEQVDHLDPVKKMVNKVGIEMPDLVAEGSLTVKTKDEPEEEVNKEVNKKDIPLPVMGGKFMLNGHEYKVIYINEGQHRFTCEPCKGVY